MKKWVLYLFIFIQCLHGIPTLTMETVNVPRVDPKATAGKGEAGYTVKPEREVPEASMSEIEKQTLEREKRIKEAQANEGAKTTKTNQQRTITEEQYQQELANKPQEQLTSQQIKVIEKSIQSTENAFKDTIQDISYNIQHNKPMAAGVFDNVSHAMNIFLSDAETLLRQNEKFTSFNSLQFITWDQLGDQQSQFINLLEQSNLFDSLIRSLTVLKLDLKLDPQDQSKLDVIKKWVQNQVELKNINLEDAPINYQIEIYRALRNAPNKNIYYALQFKDRFEGLYQDNLADVKASKKKSDARNQLLLTQETLVNALVENYEYLMSKSASPYISMTDFRQFAHRFTQLEGKSLLTLWNKASNLTGDAKAAVLKQLATRWTSFTSFLSSCGSPFDILYAMRLGMPAARTLVRLNNAQGQDALSASDDMLDLAMNLNQWNRFNDNQAYFFNKPSITQTSILPGNYAQFADMKFQRYQAAKETVDAINAEITNNSQNYTASKIQFLQTEAAYQAYIMREALGFAASGYEQATISSVRSDLYSKQITDLKNNISKAQTIDMVNPEYQLYFQIADKSESEFKARKASELNNRLDKGAKNATEMQKLIEKNIKAQLNPNKSKVSDILKLVFFLLPLMIAIIQLIANEEEDKGQIPAFTPKSGSSGMFL